MAQARLCNITQCLREKREKPMPRFRTVDDLDVSGKRVLVRADLNVPVKDGKVTDATRIERLAPTIEALGAALENPQRPVIALIGGAKVSTKLDLLNNLTGRVDRLAIGGAMANTFLFAQGQPVGRSLCERELADTARKILDEAKARGCEVILPVDAVTAEKLEAGAVTRTVGINAVPATAMILDVGPQSVAHIAAGFEASRTLVWNGPVGAFETAPFERATVALAKKAAELTHAGKLLSVAGGGDTVAAL